MCVCVCLLSGQMRATIVKWLQKEDFEVLLCPTVHLSVQINLLENNWNQIRILIIKLLHTTKQYTSITGQRIVDANKWSALNYINGEGFSHRLTSSRPFHLSRRNRNKTTIRHWMAKFWRNSIWRVLAVIAIQLHWTYRICVYWVLGFVWSKIRQ